MSEVKRRKVAHDAPAAPKKSKKDKAPDRAAPAASPESIEESATVDGVPVEEKDETPKTFKELVRQKNPYTLTCVWHSC